MPVHIDIAERYGKGKRIACKKGARRAGKGDFVSGFFPFIFKA